MIFVYNAETWRGHVRVAAGGGDDAAQLVLLTGALARVSLIHDTLIVHVISEPRRHVR